MCATVHELHACACVCVQEYMSMSECMNAWKPNRMWEFCRNKGWAWYKAWSWLRTDHVHHKWLRAWALHGMVKAMKKARGTAVVHQDSQQKGLWSCHMAGPWVAAVMCHECEQGRLYWALFFSILLLLDWSKVVWPLSKNKALALILYEEKANSPVSINKRPWTKLCICNQLKTNFFWEEQEFYHWRQECVEHTWERHGKLLQCALLEHAYNQQEKSCYLGRS